MRPKLTLSLLSAVLFVVPTVRADEWRPITPEDLKFTEPGAPAVILYENYESDDTKSSAHHYVRVKILSEEGKKYATVEIPYNRELEKIVEIHGRTIRPDGSIVPFDGKVFEKTVIKGHGIKILEKAFTLPDVQVGSIIEYKYGNYWADNKVGGARWIVQDELKKLHAHYSYKPYLEDVITAHGNIGSGVFWSSLLPNGEKPAQNQMTHVVDLDLQNVPAFEEEEFMPPASQMKYRVMFYYGGGRDLKNVDQFWKEEAKYWNKEVNKFLHSGSAVAALVTEAGIAPNDTPEAKAKKIYDRIQKIENLSYARERTAAEDKRAHYKPPKSAEDVAKFGAGFDTEITRLYVAAARAAGLQAYPMEVSTRDEFFFTKQIPDANQLNSEIAIVDLGGGKEIFLDPGTKTCPFGLMHWKRTNVTGIRQLPSGDAGFAETPQADPNKSLTVRVARLKMAPDGSADGEVEIAFRGQEALIHRLDYLNSDEQGRKKDIEDEVREWIPDGSELKLTQLKNMEAIDEPLIATFSVKMPQLGASAGKRLLLPTGVFELKRRQVLMHSQRKQPIYFSYPYRELDKALIELPPGMQVDTLPEAKDINNGFSIYRVKRTASGSQIVLDRDFAVLGLGLPLEYYPQLKSFFETVKSADDEQVVLKAATAVAEKGN
ncbi:MAG TPA: DUF3857 domain-containing protein [Terriglobales bacterium]